MSDGATGAKSAAAIATALLWSNGLLPRLGLDVRGRTAANAGFATGYALVFGSRANWWSVRGLRYGLASAAVVVAGYGAAVAVPGVRSRLREFADRGPDVTPAEWIAVHIPIGTVYSEELVFRGTLDPLLDTTFGTRAGILLGASTFGLWHIHPARAAGDSVAVTVAATALGGLVFGLLRRRSDSAAASALLHLAVNAGGALAPWLAARWAHRSTR
ncbi:CPBP family intramembrane glutamic endopeptidase [Nocardia sp. NBC_01009]|uniref:CPBP family intramembrane glutamic endopeptidase n=1 Tax=Nocardia sp. NBC_01009 TaxID=2975996 RepID=UPI003865D8A2|nr:CPBP family intramembrane metalloprotease [Nocardia sp. NBC_01009]